MRVINWPARKGRGRRSDWSATIGRRRCSARGARDPEGCALCVPSSKRLQCRASSTPARNAPWRLSRGLDLGCFYDGVSDLDVLETLLESGAKVQGIRGLHAKLFLFGSEVAIGTSANVTDACCATTSSASCPTMPRCSRAARNTLRPSGKGPGSDLTRARLREWRTAVSTARRNGGGGKRPRLPDYGARAETTTPFAPGPSKKRYENDRCRP